MQRKGVAQPTSLPCTIEISELYCSFARVLGDPFSYDLPNPFSIIYLISCKLVKVDDVEITAIFSFRGQRQQPTRRNRLPLVLRAFGGARVEGKVRRRGKEV